MCSIITHTEAIRVVKCTVGRSEGARYDLGALDASDRITTRRTFLFILIRIVSEGALLTAVTTVAHRLDSLV